mmetsp:Transcript_28134/g.42554  ORF Transcript_28134/g.42554 Transcript_28134/m.42554 type:complete len:111 (-) Transcript_28134:1039-1371(-)
MQFINIAVVLLLVNFNIYNDSKQHKVLNFIPFLDGDYKDFTVAWYHNVGATLCITLTLNIFAPHLSKAAGPTLVSLRRCLDRGCRCSKREHKRDSVTDSVRTKKKLLSEL